MSYPTALERVAQNFTEGGYAPSRLFGYTIAAPDPQFVAANPAGMSSADIGDRWNFYLAGTDNGIVHAAIPFFVLGAIGVLAFQHFTK